LMIQPSLLEVAPCFDVYKTNNNPRIENSSLNPFKVSLPGLDGLSGGDKIKVEQHTPLHQRWREIGQSEPNDRKVGLRERYPILSVSLTLTLADCEQSTIQKLQNRSHWWLKASNSNLSIPVAVSSLRLSTGSYFSEGERRAATKPRFSALFHRVRMRLLNSALLISGRVAGLSCAYTTKNDQ